MKSASAFVIWAAVQSLLWGCGANESEQAKAVPTVVLASRTHGLTQARDGFQSKLQPSPFENEPLADPPPDVFRLVRYESPVGSLGAYVTPDPQDGKKHPAIIWITGGDCNAIGDVWNASPEDNDQTASAYRQAGIVMMFPSLRGAHDNPGVRECFLGEVEDILAAAEFLSKLSYVDAKRIYLGGHSTGGMLVLLVAESTSRFRAVFSFGPAADVRQYGDGYSFIDTSNPKEAQIRSPIHWLDWVGVKTFVIEGADGNPLDALMQSTSNQWIQFYSVKGANHFNILAPTNRLIAQKILRDNSSTCEISLSERELQKPFAK